MFTGRNNIGPQGLFNERSRHNATAHTPSPLGRSVIKNIFFAEMQYYGVIDPNGDIVIPDADKMQLGAPGSSVGDLRAFDFIFDMFVTMKTNVEFCILNGSLGGPQSNPEIVAMKPHRSFESPMLGYRAYIQNMLIYFNEEEIPLEYGKHNIMNFEQYVKSFRHFLSKNKSGVPITLSGWLSSNLNSFHSNGLTISVSPRPISNDLGKAENWYNHQQWDYWQNLCVNNAFSIHLNAPWCLIAELNSPAMIKYYEKYNIVDTQDMFDKYYIKSKYMDINIIKDYIIQYYNNYAVRNNYQTFIDQQKGCVNVNAVALGSNLTGLGSLRLNKTTVTHTFRYEISQSDAYAMYADDIWIQFYAEMRNIENGMVYDKGKIEEIKKYSKKITNKLDISSGIDYIDNEFKGLLFERDFGAKSLLRRFKQKKMMLDFQQGITTGPSQTAQKREAPSTAYEGSQYDASAGASGGSSGGSSGGGGY